MSNTVVINRTYASARTGELVDATSAASWQALLDRLSALAVAVAPFIAASGADGVIVTCQNMRGADGAFAVHDLACRFGAIAVIE